MEQLLIYRMALEYQAKGKRDIGRPKTRWTAQQHLQDWVFTGQDLGVLHLFTFMVMMMMMISIIYKSHGQVGRTLYFTFGRTWVLISSQETVTLIQDFYEFPQCVQTHSDIVPQIRSEPFLFTSFIIHYSLTRPPFEATYSEIWEIL